MSRSARFTRRTFARATGLSLALLPVLEADKILRAAPSDATNLVTIAWPNGVRATEWWPDAIKDADYLPDDKSGVTETNFSFANRKISGPLEPHKADLLFFLFAGLTAKVEGGHESGPEMFKVSGGNSLDQHVARNHTTPFKTLNLAVQKHDNRGHIFKRRAKRFAGARSVCRLRPFVSRGCARPGRTNPTACEPRQRAGLRA